MLPTPNPQQTVRHRIGRQGNCLRGFCMWSSYSSELRILSLWYEIESQERVVLAGANIEWTEGRDGSKIGGRRARKEGAREEGRERERGSEEALFQSTRKSNIRLKLDIPSRGIKRNLLLLASSANTHTNARPPAHPPTHPQTYTYTNTHILGRFYRHKGKKI